MGVGIFETTETIFATTHVLVICVNKVVTYFGITCETVLFTGHETLRGPASVGSYIRRCIPYWNISAMFGSHAASAFILGIACLSEANLQVKSRWSWYRNLQWWHMLKPAISC